MTVANGYIAGIMEEGCSNCHVWNHYFFVCPTTAQVTRLFSCCWCHGYLWDHCDNRDFVRVGLNATMWFAHCCRSTCYAGCYKGTFITVSLKGTEACPCFDPADYTIRCCRFQGSNISDLFKQNQVGIRSGWEYSHPLSAYGKIHINNKPFSGCGASQEPTDFSCGWLGRSGLEFTTEAVGTRIYKPAAGSYRAATVPNGATTPVFYTTYVPCNIDDWGCLWVECVHPSTPCVENLEFVCWAHGSGPNLGYENKWHLGVFQSCNCTLSCCKRYTYLALFCG